MVVGGEGGFGVSLETAVVFASGLSPVLGGTPRGKRFARALPPAARSSPPSLMASLQLEEIKPPWFALSWDELSWVDWGSRTMLTALPQLPKAPQCGDGSGSPLLPILSPSAVPTCSIWLQLASLPALL